MASPFPTTKHGHGASQCIVAPGSLTTPSLRPSYAPRTALRARPAAQPHSKRSRQKPSKTSEDASTPWSSPSASSGTSSPSRPLKIKANTGTNGYSLEATRPLPS
eukprot:15391189-Heterocapsa_arctica.AAC.1